MLPVLRERYFVFAPVEDEPDAPPDPLGAAEPDEDEPLGEELLGAADPDDEDDPLGEAAGLAEVSALAWTPSFDAVSVSRRPVAFRPSVC